MADQERLEVLQKERENIIVRTSVIGILTNLFLVGFKAAVGLIAHSIAVVLDALNNLTDVISSVVTIVGAKLGNRLPDKQHPLGHGRIEYVSSMIVAALVLYAGIAALVESVKKIIDPVTADYSTVAIVILVVAVLVKLVLGLYVRKAGERAKSGALKASGTDALFDAILSGSVLASAVIYLIFGLSLEAYVGVLISIFILKTGIGIFRETLNDIIGRREDAEMSRRLKAIIAEEEPVRGVYDVTLFDYGPSRHYASVHIELPDTMTVKEVDELTRRIQVRVMQETGVVLTGVGVYSFNTSNDEAALMQNRVTETVMRHDWALQMHGFYVDTEKKTLRFDVVVSFDTDRKKALETLCGEVKALYPEYELTIVPDVDITD